VISDLAFTELNADSSELERKECLAPTIRFIAASVVIKLDEVQAVFILPQIDALPYGRAVSLKVLLIHTLNN